MRALQLIAVGQLRIHDVPTPDVGPNDVLVRVAGVGLCHSDVHVLHMPGWPRFPLTMGHETAGWIAGCGSAVRGFAEGEPVLVGLVWACGYCRACLEGRDNACLTSMGSPPCPGLGTDGGMAEFMVVPSRYLHKLGTVDPRTAGPLADAGLTAYHAIESARRRLNPGSTAVVIGAGGLGHVAIQILRATSSVRIVAVDNALDKLELARTYGADETLLSDDGAAGALREMTDGHGVDAVFDFVGVQPTVTLATKIIAPDGAIRFTGIGGGSFMYEAAGVATLPWGVDVRRSYAGTRQDQQAVIELASAGKLAVETQLYPLEDGITAFDDLEAGRIVGRAVLVP